MRFLQQSHEADLPEPEVLSQHNKDEQMPNMDEVKTEKHNERAV